MNNSTMQMMMTFAWYDWVGSFGVLCILTCYFLLQRGQLNSQDPRYSWGNLIGAALILLSLCFRFNWSAFFIESAWVLISLMGLIRRPTDT